MRSLIFCSILMFMSAAHAELTSSQMKSAHARVVYEFPTTQKEISERLMRWNRDLSYKFSQTRDYIKSNGYTMNGPGED